MVRISPDTPCCRKQEVPGVGSGVSDKMACPCACGVRFPKTFLVVLNLAFMVSLEIIPKNSFQINKLFVLIGVAVRRYQKGMI